MVTHGQFVALLTILIPGVISLICENYGWDELTAVKKFYTSGVYKSLEIQDTWVWHFSPLTLFGMFDEEMRTGSFEFPEEI